MKMFTFHLDMLCLNRKILITGIVFILLNTIFITKTDACVDPDTIITVTVNYNESLTEIEIRLDNMKLHTETPNTFCSCALGSYTDFYSNLKYVAFMKDGTDELYPNFTPWTNESEVDNAWNISQPNNGDWAGYIAEVINNGLTINESVELVIRASLPPGTLVAVSELDSILSISWLGTDEWDDSNNTLSEDHQGVRNLRNDNSSFEINLVTDDYFNSLDGIILSDDEFEKLENSIKINPNPFSDFIHINLELEKDYSTIIQLLDINGRVKKEIYQGKFYSGQQSLEIPIHKQNLPPGIYFIRIEMNDKIIIKRVAKH